MSLRFKILSGFLILSIMLFAAGLLSVYELKQIGHSVRGLLDENYKSINAAKNMIESLEREDSGILVLISGEWEKGRSTIREADRDFQNAFNIAKHNITISGEKERIDAIEASYAFFKKLWLRPIVETQRQGNLNWYFSEVHPAFLKTKTSVNQLMALNDEAMYRMASGLQNRASRAVMPGIVAIVSALVFTIIFNFFINLYVILPIKRLTNGIQAYIKHGEQPALSVESRDEISRLAGVVQDLIFHVKPADKKQ
ncbi:MAG: MCP four helix bundle domain-containing protein [Pseudomonadota bacterium]